jgi:uncharacterized protein YbbC (DUF1343 family)
MMNKQITLAVILLILNGSAAAQHKVLTGIDVLQKNKYVPLVGKRIGLITNQTGINADGKSTIELLAHAPGVKLKALFAPEHGITGSEDREGISDAIDRKTGVKIYSLYGTTRRPTAAMLEKIDILVYDIQDVGARYYTYITTLGYALEEAAKLKKKFIVLDRPVMIRGDIVEGDILPDSVRSFTGYYPIPVRYGMTPGEIATMYKATAKLDVDLEVVKCEGWNRSMWFDETGLAWRNPSPNIRNCAEAILYSGLGALEVTNLSVGRGTDMPFEVIGAPYLQAKDLADMMNAIYILGMRFHPVDFTPTSGPFKDELCHGVRFEITDRNALRVSPLMIKLANEIRKQSPLWDYHTDRFWMMVGTKDMISMFDANACTCQITSTFTAKSAQFEHFRLPYLLYK